MTASNGLHVELHTRVGRLTLTADFKVSGGTLAVIGPNGSGKSTMLRCILGAFAVERAFLSVGDTILCDTTKRISLPVESRRLAYVPQDYALFPHLTVRQNVSFALESRARRFSGREREDRIDSVLTELKISDFGRRYPHTLSGGERQRVAIARALVTEPLALLLDEPLAALDVHSRNLVREFLAGYLSQLTIPTILVTHDATEARHLASQLLVLENGRVTQQGTWSELLVTPASGFVRDFVTPRAEVA